MATTTISGSTVTFSNSGAAADLTNSSLTEDSSSLSLTFNVLASSGGGTNTTIYSVDDGIKGDNTSEPVITTNKAFATYDTDLLYADTTGATWQTNGDTSVKGAYVWIGSDNLVHYDASNLSSTLNALGAGQTFTDSFDYTIKMSNGTLSVGTINVNIAGQIDAPVLSASAAHNASVDEGGTIGLNISATDVDDNASLSYTVSGVTGGAALSAGTDLGNGTWSLTGAQLNGLTLTAGAEQDGPINLHVVATNTEGSATAMSSADIAITVHETADAPNLGAPATLSVDEGNTVALGITASAAETDQNAPTLVITGVPSDATLSAGTLNSDGTWSLTAAQLSGLTMTAGESTHAITLTVTATDNEFDTSAQSTSHIAVTVHETADAPNLTVPAVALDVDEGHSVDLGISASALEADQAAPTITINGVTGGATLSAGTDNGDGSWSLTADQLSNLSLNTTSESDGTLHLTVTATDTEFDTHADSTATITVNVHEVADAPNLTVPTTALDVDEGNGVALGISASALEADQAAPTITISGVTGGATLSAGTDNGDGSWSLTADQLSNLSLNTTSESDGTLHLTVTATDNEFDTSAQSQSTIAITVHETADAPNLGTPATLSVDEGNTVALGITASAAETDQNAPTLLISGVPTDATLSAGTLNNDGTWSVTAAQLSGLTLTAGESTHAITLTVTATDNEFDTSAQSQSTINVTVHETADAPNLGTPATLSVDEGNTVALGITASAAETDQNAPTLVITGVPSDATLSAGTLNSDGTWSLTAAQLSGLTMTAGESTHAITLTVTATDNEFDTSAQSQSTIAITVHETADAPNLGTPATLSVDEGNTVALGITASAAETDQNAPTLLISGVPTDATLSAGTLNNDGTWSVTAAQLSGLTLTAGESTHSITLTVTATDSEFDTQATSAPQTIAITVNEQADAPTLTATAASSTIDEGQSVALNITAVKAEPDQADPTVTITGLPSDASLTNTKGDTLTISSGSITLNSDQLAGLTLHTGESTHAISLSVEATDTETDTSATSAAQTIAITVNEQADAPTLTATAASSTIDEGQSVALNITAVKAEPDQADPTVTITGLPSDASLTNTKGDTLTISSGSITLNSDQLAGLTLHTGESTHAISLSVTATDTETDTSATSAPQTIAITVNEQADAPTLTAAAASSTIDEGQSVALNITAVKVEPDQADPTVTISGLPSDVTLTNTHGDALTIIGGSITLTTDQLAGLTLHTGESTHAISLSVEATDTETDTSATSAAQTIAITVNEQADAPNLSVTSQTLIMNEGGSVALNISASAAEVDQHAPTVVISGVPLDALLSAGTNNQDGTWSLTAAQLSGLTLTPASEFEGPINLTVTATDTEIDTHAQSQTTIAITVNGVADTPIISTPAAKTTGENVAVGLTGLSVTSANPGTSDDNDTFTVNLSVSHGSLSVGGAHTGLTGTFTGSSISFSGSLTDIDAALADNNISYSPTTNFAGSDTLNFTATSTEEVAAGGGTSPLTTDHSATITVTPPSSPPVVDLNGGGTGNDAAASYPSGTSPNPVVIAPLATITDASESHLTSMTITLTNATDSTPTNAKEMLSLDAMATTAAAGLTVSPTTGLNAGIPTYTLTVSGSASVATYQTILEGVQYADTKTGNNHDQTPRVVDVVVNDGFNNSAAQTVTIAVAKPAGIAGSPIDLALGVAPTGTLAAVNIADVPTGWTINGATHLADGSWSVQSTDLSSLTVTTPGDFAGAAVLHAVETWTNAVGTSGRALISDNVEAYAPGSPIFAVSSDDHLTGAGGNDQFVFSQPIGNDTISNFNAAGDQIDLIGYAGFASFADVQSHLADDTNGNAVLTLGTGQSITINGVHSASLTASDFVFDQTPTVNNAAAMTIGDGAVLPLSGIVNNSGTIALNSVGDESDLQLIQHGITLQGGGQVVMSDSGANGIVGTESDVTLTNVDNTISGAGQIGEGQLTLVNQGSIIATGANALTIDTGTNIVVNSGILEATGSGGLDIASGVANSGNLWADGGNIVVNGEVTGTGTAQISNAATIEFGSASSANVTFDASATGILKLDDASHFTGAISGFSASDTIDLTGIQSVSAQVSYVANADGSGGLLSVTDGTHTASIAMLGQYDPAGFHFAADQAAGVLLTYTDMHPLA